MADVPESQEGGFKFPGAVTTLAIVTLLVWVAVLFIPMLASRPFLAGGAQGRASGSAPSNEPPRRAPLPPAPWSDVSWGFATLLPAVLLVIGRSLAWVFAAVLRVAGILALLLGRLLTLLLWPVRTVFDRAWAAVERTYPRVLGVALAHPLLVIGVALVLLGWAAWRVPTLGVQLLPEIHQGEFTAHIGLEVGTPLEETDRIVSQLERELARLPDVETTALVIGVEQETLSREIEGEHTARLTVRMPDDAIVAAREEALLARVRTTILDRPEVRTLDFTRPTPFALESPIAVEVRGRDLDQLQIVGRAVAERLERMPELADVRTTVRVGHPEARVVFDRDKTLEFGLDLRATATLVRDQLLGNISTRFVEGDERIAVRVQADESALDTLDAVMSLVVNPSSETPIPLSAVASIEIVRGPAEIRRIGNTRAVVVGAVSTGLDLAGISEEIERAVAEIDRPDEVEIVLGGQKREMEDGLQSMRFALLLAIFLVYVVMASQFESLIQPLVIMLTVPLAAVGVVALLDLSGTPLSVVVFLGLILLAGVVVNNAIVLVDRINARIASEMPLREAILEAGHARLRPILMTTATTALGLLPMTGWLIGVPGLGAFGGGEGAELRAPMAITVIGGLISSTALTLIVVPVAYALVHGGLRAGRRAKAEEARP